MRHFDLTRCLFVPFALMLMVIFLGCAHAPSEHSKIVHLRFSVWGVKQEADLANTLAREFERAHPNVRIDVEPVAGVSYDMKLTMQSAAGTMPDVIFMLSSYIYELAQFHTIMDLTELANNDPTFRLSDIYPQMLQTGMNRSGRIFMLPREMGVVVMFYNRTLFRKAGLPDPGPDWTYKDLLRIAKKLTIRDENGRIVQYGLSLPYSWSGLFSSWVASNGGSVVSEDGKRSTLSDPETLRAMCTLVDLVNVHKVAMPPNQSLTAPGINPFVAGKVAMVADVFPQVPQYRATMKHYDWDVQIMPKGLVKRVINMGAAGYGISATTKHPKEAWEFLKFVVSKRGQRVFARTGSGIPSLKSLAHDSCWRASGSHPRNLDAFINSIKYGLDNRKFIFFDKVEVMDIDNLAFEKVFTHQATVKQAFKEADDKINAILQREREDEN